MYLLLEFISNQAKQMRQQKPHGDGATNQSSDDIHASGLRAKLPFVPLERALTTADVFEKPSTVCNLSTATPLDCLYLELLAKSGDQALQGWKNQPSVLPEGAFCLAKPVWA